ncbi:MAG: protein kinase, partial [Jaaginema sp. PMC 1079.18]|nr:protein kinase [Jaaginema sp. PMC 1079.18]
SLHCVNPDCPQPYPQPGHHKFCQRCGTSLRLHNRYLPRQRLGTGGFAVIYTVWDSVTQTEKVLKILTVASEKALQLFEQEAAVLTTVRHPGVPQVEPNSFFQIQTLQNTLFCLVMEKIHGQTLEDILLNQYPQGCPENLVLDWLYQAADILTTLHQHFIIHRDIKPSNLMLRDNASQPQLVLIDFGGAKQLNTGDSSTRLFSSGYSPPEQIAGNFVEPATDIYALGRTAIHLLTGQYPPDLEDVRTGELCWRDRVKINPKLAAIIDSMVQLDIKQRPQRARDLKNDLAVLMGNPLSPLGKNITIPGITRVVLPQMQGREWQNILALSGKVSVFLLKSFYLTLKLGSQAITAILDTTHEAISGGIGAAIGASFGFVLANWTPVGRLFAGGIAYYLPQILAGIEVTVEPQILLFALAGLGTGWGLSRPRGFGQRKQVLFASLTGLVGYVAGWLFWQGMPYGVVENFIALLLTAGTVLVLGLGLPSYILFHALFVATGTGLAVLGIVYGGGISPFLIADLLALNRFDLTIIFCSGLAIVWAIALGISYHAIVPLLAWLERK